MKPQAGAATAAVAQNNIQQQQQRHRNQQQQTNATTSSPLSQVGPIQFETLNSFPVNQLQKFDILLATHLKPSDLIVNISNPILGLIDRQLDWLAQEQRAEPKSSNRCRVSFKAPVVGVYNVNIELAGQTQFSNAQFQAKAYDLSKVFIHNSSSKCFINESYEFSVDASEAGEGQLEIAVNEGEIPNQVQVLDNGKCIVNFVPEAHVPHIVDIKFNGYNVIGCPFVVEVEQEAEEEKNKVAENQLGANNVVQQKPKATQELSKPLLIKEERVLINSVAMFSLENVNLNSINFETDLLIFDPENQPISYELIQHSNHAKYKFEFSPSVVGDYTVELKPNSPLASKLPNEILEQFPFPLKVFDHNKVIVTDVTDGVIGHPVYFFIDASQAGSGNLEIRVSSTTRNVPNYPQSEANAKIRVSFTPTEAVDHSIDVKFNGISVPGNPFLVKVALYPQARLPVLSQDLLKYIAIDESVTFYIDYIGTRENKNIPVEELTNDSCQVYLLKPDLMYMKLNSVELTQSEKNDRQARFKIAFKPTKIGPYKLFITVNNEILPASPIISNVYNIDEVKVYFELTDRETLKPIGHLNKPVTFTVDASRAGEGTLALAVVSGISRSPVQTDVKVSEKGHGLYNLTFVPIEFASHSIDMSFNDRLVPNSPFIVDILNSSGKSSASLQQQQQQQSQQQHSSSKQTGDTDQRKTKPLASEDSNSLVNHQQLVQNFEAMSLKQSNGHQPAPKSAAKVSKPSVSSSSSTTTTTSKKSLAFGLVNASNVVYLESGVLENMKNQVNIIGPRGEQVPFKLAKGSPQPGEAKKPFIEYNPESIGTHTINVFDELKELRQYYVEICDPSLIRITDLDPGESFLVGRPISFCLDTQESGEIQLDSVAIIGPRRASGKIRDGDQTILGRIKSMSSSSGSQINVPVEYSLTRLNDHKQEIRFVPQIPGKYSIDIKCLGQPVGPSPFTIEVRASVQSDRQLYAKAPAKAANKTPVTVSRDDELIQSIVVHGISLKCSPVNSTGAFIIETNRLAKAHDFDVLITDPANKSVDVKFYSQQDGNLLAEWTPERVGTHKIEVLYKDSQVPNSPFVTEVFDPSGVIIESIKTTNYMVNDKIEFRLDRKAAGYGELDVAITSPVGQDLAIDVRPLAGNDNQLGEIISFTPTIAGKYKMSITFGGYEVPKSPITFIARDIREPVKANGNGLKCAEVNRSAQFFVESSNEGELKLRIECGDREIVPKIERQSNIHTIKYKPTEVGYAAISLYWNGSHVEGSPFSVPINDLSKILFLSGTNKMSNSNNQRIIDYEPNIPKEITVDTSKCGPGELKAEAYCRADPNLKFSIPIQQYVANRYKLVFTCPPKQEQLSKGVSLRDISLETTYLIRLYYNNLIVPEPLASVVVSPLHTKTNRDISSARANGISEHLENGTTNNNNNLNNNNNNNNNINAKPQIVADRAKNGVDCPPTVALRGHGLVDAKCGEKAEFTIDGSEAGPGKPEVKFSGSSDEIKVCLELIEGKLYRATYEAQNVGVYSLNVLWDGKQVAGCPISINVLGNCDPTKVICTGDGLKGGVMGEEIKTFIDTRRAGPGELTALCTGPQKVALCELLDRGDGTFILYIKPQEPGRQLLTIKYGGQHIPKSPFLIKVSGKPDPSKVRVYGPGVEHGVLSLYQSRFVCDTRGAGAGQLTVRIRGPKGAFRMETQRESQRDRTILCKYDPTEPGDYRIEIKWSGKHVPGSPFSVMIFDTQEELNRFLISKQQLAHTDKLIGHHLHHQQQVPYQPTMVEYGNYSNMNSGQQQQPQFRLP